MSVRAVAHTHANCTRAFKHPPVHLWLPLLAALPRHAAPCTWLLNPGTCRQGTWLHWPVRVGGWVRVCLCACACVAVCVRAHVCWGEEVLPARLVGEQVDV